MTALLDGRPAGLDAFYRPGKTFTVTLTWPTGELADRTFTAALDETALTVDITDDVMTITASAAQTTTAGEGSHAFELVETTSGTETVIVGTWVGSQRGAVSQSTSVTVADTAGSVEVQVVAVSAVGDLTVTRDATIGGTAAIAGDATIAGDTTITGVIKTGTFGAPATFGGIEREARYWSAGDCLSPTGVINFGDGVPRINMPAGVRTDVYAVVEIEEWWLDHTIGCYMEWSNDHTDNGNVRWECEIVQHNIATEDLDSGTTLVSRTFTATVPFGRATTSIIARDDGTHDACDLANPGPGVFASFYVFRYSRLGADPLDTLAGPVGFIAGNMTRGQ